MDRLAKANADEPAFPHTYQIMDETVIHQGLTKREEIAARIMAAHYANSICTLDAKHAAINAVAGADALLEALETCDIGAELGEGADSHG
jgi:hypothetical protein